MIRSTYFDDIPAGTYTVIANPKQLQGFTYNVYNIRVNTRYLAYQVWRLRNPLACLQARR